MTNEEREAREWLEGLEQSWRGVWPEPARSVRTILALLDRPVMPKPDEVPDDVLRRMQTAWNKCLQERQHAMRAAYRALYDHYHQPPKPKKVEAWAVVWPDGSQQVSSSREIAEREARIVSGSRIVHLREVEADHDH